MSIRLLSWKIGVFVGHVVSWSIVTGGVKSETLFNYWEENPTRVRFIRPNGLNLFSLIPDGWEQHTNHGYSCRRGIVSPITLKGEFGNAVRSIPVTTRQRSILYSPLSRLTPFM